MERKVGEIFTYNGKTYRVVKGSKCENCEIEGHCVTMSSIIGPCVDGDRSDDTNIVFKEVKKYMDIKNNQLTIDIPEGMEIDLENSDLAKGIIRFKQITITYENVEDALKLGKNCKSIIVNESNASKLVALSKLMNIAKYYNKDWKPNCGEYKYHITYNNEDNTYLLDYNSIYTLAIIYFKNRKDAQAVIDNPNFRDILDAVYKN